MFVSADKYIACTCMWNTDTLYCAGFSRLSYTACEIKQTRQYNFLYAGSKLGHISTVTSYLHFHIFNVIAVVLVVISDSNLLHNCWSEPYI